MDSLYFPVKKCRRQQLVGWRKQSCKVLPMQKIALSSGCGQIFSHTVTRQHLQHVILLKLSWSFYWSGLIEAMSFSKQMTLTNFMVRACMFRIPDRLLGWYSFGCWYCWCWSWWWSAKCYFAFRFRPSPNKLCLMNLKKTWICMLLEITLYICI